MAPRWYAARTEPRAEYQAASQLSRDGFEIFFPRVKTPHPRIGHTDMPLFPGYLFLRCDPEGGSWPLFRPGHRILGWVKFGSEVASLPDAEVSELMARVESINRQGGLWRRYRPGEWVRVLSHGMATVAEVVEESKSPQGRVKVLLEFMGRLVSAQVGWQDLTPIQDEQYPKRRVPRRTRGGGRWIRDAGSPALSTA